MSQIIHECNISTTEHHLLSRRVINDHGFESWPVCACPMCSAVLDRFILSLTHAWSLVTASCDDVEDTLAQCCEIPYIISISIDGEKAQKGGGKVDRLTAC